MSPTFAARLNRLFDTVHPPGRGPHASCELIRSVKAVGVSLSAIESASGHPYHR
jgi:hypothetical protein